MAATNLTSNFAGLGVERHQQAYLQFVAEAEDLLRSDFEDSELWRDLHSDHFWHIRELRFDSPRPGELIGREAERQANRLREARAALNSFLDWAQRDESPIAMLDTHVLLHFMPLDQIDWREVTETERARLVLPLRVVEELDAKKYTASDPIAKRARQVISHLRSRLPILEDGGIPVSGSATLEVQRIDEPRRRTHDADQEVLDACLELVNLGIDVRLVSGDAGVDIRARRYDIAVSPMPDRYLRRQLD